ncbi:hypothetical protein QYZ45_17635 [Vibrio parahaemolyticus]|nr:hypothetical protein [Vibrio parahaemolyticus]
MKHSAYGTTIQSVQDFITETIDGWHYPTLVDANGKATITIQSLHQDRNSWLCIHLTVKTPCLSVKKAPVSPKGKFNLSRNALT